MPDTRATCQITMSTITAWLLALALLLVPGVMGAHGETDSSSKAGGLDVQEMQELLKRVEQLESANQVLEDEVRHLKASEGEQWLSEQRAQQIRTVVTDVLADAGTRASLQSDAMTAGWNDGFFLASPDGRFLLKIDGMTQFRFVLNHTRYVNPNPFNNNGGLDRWRWGFENTRTRLTFSGHVFGPDLQYLVRGEFSRGVTGQVTPDISNGDRGGFRLLDAWARYNLTEDWSLRIGQFKLPFSREELVSSAYQQVIERSLVNEAFNLGRSQGLELYYRGSDFSWALSYTDGGSVNLPFTIAGTGAKQFGGFTRFDFANSPWSDPTSDFSFTSRLEWKPAGDWQSFKAMTSPMGQPFAMMFGLAGHYQKDESGAKLEGQSFPTPDETFTTDFWAVTADASFQFGGANLFFSGYYVWMDIDSLVQNTDSASGWGATAQGGLYFTPKLEGFARFEYGDYNIHGFDFPGNPAGFAPDGDLLAMTLGANYYLDGQDVKLSGDISLTFNEMTEYFSSDIAGFRPDQSSDAQPQIVIRTQFQLLF